MCIYAIKYKLLSLLKVNIYIPIQSIIYTIKNNNGMDAYA
jgi:hypothetical protein